MSDGKNGFEKTKHNFPYEWTLKDAVFTKDKGKVFSCSACGGGSTMRYKLAGFDVLGCVFCHLFLLPYLFPSAYA